MPSIPSQSPSPPSISPLPPLRPSGPATAALIGLALFLGALPSPLRAQASVKASSFRLESIDFQAGGVPVQPDMGYMWTDMLYPSLRLPSFRHHGHKPLLK